MKLSKVKDTTDSKNSVVWTSEEIESSGIENRQYDFDLGGIEFEDGESISLAWERTDTGGGTRYFYFDELRLDLERT